LVLLSTLPIFLRCFCSPMCAHESLIGIIGLSLDS
jgi:hypothetical protein